MWYAFIGTRSIVGSRNPEGDLDAMAKKLAPKTQQASAAPKPSGHSMERAAIRWLLEQERIRADRPGHTGNQRECGLHIENLS